MAMVSRSLVLNSFKVNRSVLCRFISTSKKNKDGHITLTPESLKTPIPDFSRPQDNRTWLSYGFSTTERLQDRHKYNMRMFCAFSYIIVGGFFFFAYYPDMQLAEWSHREAFVVLRERELAGMDAIDPWYVDPATIELPTDEELGDTEIIL